MNSVLKLWKDVFLKGIKLPDSYYEVKMKLGKLGLGYKTKHVCKYDCALFSKENVDLHFCPVYNTSRWKSKKNKR